MSTHEVLTECQARDVHLSVANGSLTYDAPKGALSPDLLALLKAHKVELLAALAQPPNLDAILVEVCRGVDGIDPATFRSLLSADDVTDILAGDIPAVPTLRAYARSFADGIRTGRIRVLAAAMHKPAVTSWVRCADCRHFERDTIGGSGIGRCKIGGEGTGLGHPALWPNAERACQDFTASAETSFNNVTGNL